MLKNFLLLVTVTSVCMSSSIVTMAFVPTSIQSKYALLSPTSQVPLKSTRSKHALPLNRSCSTSRLYLLLDVPDGFFTVTFPMLGLLLSFSKTFARIRMEENAWEQRLQAARLEKLRSDPTLTEIDLRRQEASLEWSAYGKPRWQEQQQAAAAAAMRPDARQRERVKVMDRRDRNGNTDNPDDQDYYDDDLDRPTARSMTDDEIRAFELEYGVEYDPYYDEPYTADELPNDEPYTTDRRYGDRIYQNGEIFYKDQETGMFYRQGAKPRNLKFWQ